MKIEFGCGDRPTKQGFKTCDIRNINGVNFVCPAWDIDKLVDKNSVDEIFSRHFFEHLTFPQGERVLEVWHTILKPNGRCEIMLPNMTYHVNQWINRKSEKEFDHAKAGFWGWQREAEEGQTWDIHKSGYDEESLSALVSAKGFGNIKSLAKPKSKHLHLEFFKL